MRADLAEPEVGSSHTSPAAICQRKKSPRSIPAETIFTLSQAGIGVSWQPVTRNTLAANFLADRRLREKLGGAIGSSGQLPKISHTRRS